MRIMWIMWIMGVVAVGLASCGNPKPIRTMHLSWDQPGVTLEQVKGYTFWLEVDDSPKVKVDHPVCWSKSLGKGLGWMPVLWTNPWIPHERGVSCEAEVRLEPGTHVLLLSVSWGGLGSGPVMAQVVVP